VTIDSVTYRHSKGTQFDSSSEIGYSDVISWFPIVSLLKRRNCMLSTTTSFCLALDA
jgi:hypothetical protein